MPAFLALLLTVACAAKEPAWPDLSKPAPPIGGGKHDAAVIVGIENYAFVPEIDGAEANASAWYDYLAKTRGVPPENIVLLTGNDATREQILLAAKKAAGYAGKDGTLWFVFIGHGSSSVDGKDGLLVGVDAQQKAQSVQDRSVRRQEVLAALEGSKAKAIRVFLDACFSGRGQDGAAIVPGLQPLMSLSLPELSDNRVVVLSAAKQDQFAGPLPGGETPAFSYLVLGGLRGWAAEPDGTITAGDLKRYSSKVLQATVRGRDQVPDLMGSENALVALSAGDKPPDLAELVKASAGKGVPEPRSKKAKEDRSLRVWVGGGGSGLQQAIGWHGQVGLRDTWHRWEAAVDAGGAWNKSGGEQAGFYGDTEDIRMSFWRVKGSYLLPIRRTEFLFLPGFATLGAGFGTYYLDAISTMNFGAEKESKKRVWEPSASAGFIWPLGQRQELRLAGDYVFATNRGLNLGGSLQRFTVGGFGFTADLALRFY